MYYIQFYASVTLKKQKQVCFLKCRFLFQASEQAEIQKKIDALQAEVEKQDNDIHHLQKYLKEAEHLLVCPFALFFKH